MAQTPSPLQWLATTLIRGYQIFISPIIGPKCRFHPTCSNYALEAIRLYGFVKGSWFAGKRILKCHPLHPGGEDPVPPKNNRCNK